MKAATAPPSILVGELYLASLDSAVFSWGGRHFATRPDLSPDLCTRLMALETLPETYGRELFDAVFPQESKARDGLRQALVVAEQEGTRLRLRLRLSPGLPERVHGLFWELLHDPDRRLPLTCSADTPFARSLDMDRAPRPPLTGRPRLLCVIAAPTDLGRFRLDEIRREEVAARLAAGFAELADVLDAEILDGPATLPRLRSRLKQGGVQLLHFFAHGKRGSGAAALVLEDEHGRARPVPESELADLFEDQRELLLVTLIACHGGAPSSGDPFSGLAGRLVERGLPAVIALRRAVDFDTAHLFTEHLYRELGRAGQIDAAVNEARHQLLLANRQGLDWSSPVLYSRLADGRLWLPAAAPEAGEGSAGRPLFDFSWRRLRQPLPWLPGVVWLVLLLLRAVPAAEAEVNATLLASAVTFRLARPSEVFGDLALARLGAYRLADLRLPTGLPGLPEWAPPGPDGLIGFGLKTRGGHPQLRLDPPLLPAGAQVVLEHPEDEPSVYRVSITGADQPLGVTVGGDVLLQRQGKPPLSLRFPQPGALALYLHGGAVDLDLGFARFAEDTVTPEIAIDRLGLHTIKEHHTPHRTTVNRRSTLLGGEVQLPATGARHRVQARDVLLFTRVAGSLTDLRLGPEGIRMHFRGRATRLARQTAQLQPISLMPAMLDLWLSAAAQAALLRTLGIFALLVLIAVVAGLGVRRTAPRSTQRIVNGPMVEEET